MPMILTLQHLEYTCLTITKYRKSRETNKNTFFPAKLNKEKYDKVMYNPMFRFLNTICRSPTRQRNAVRAISTRLSCPTITSTSLKESQIDANHLERILDDWRHTIIQLQDDSDRLQLQIERLDRKLESRNQLLERPTQNRHEIIRGIY